MIDAYPSGSRSEIVSAKILTVTSMAYKVWAGWDIHMLIVSLVPETYEESSRVYVPIKEVYIQVSRSQVLSF